MSRGVESPRTALALLLMLPMGASAEDPLRFDFGPDGNASGHPAYDATRGFGFDSGAGERERFSIRVPEGNYRVTVTFDDDSWPAGFRLEAEQRRLMASFADIGGAPPSRVSVIVNVRTPELPALPDNATGGTRVFLKPREIGSPTWDDRLSLEFSPTTSRIHQVLVEPVSLRTVYLAGDSTVTDQAAAPAGSWGQFLTVAFKDTVAVANHAESGETLKSFVTELRLAKLLSALREGDWVMIQFGHNDQKAQWPQTYADAASTYPAWLRTYIAEVRRRGATPLLVTSPERRNFDGQGHIVPTLAEYAAAMRAVAREQQVALIDLNAMSVRFYETLGPQKSPLAFADDGRDKTHHSVYGAGQLALMVAGGIRTADPALTQGLEKHLRADIGPYDFSRIDTGRGRVAP